VRRREQANQRRRFLHRAGAGAEVVAGELGKGEVALGSELPREVEVDLGGERLGAAQQRVGLGLGEAQQHVGRLDLGALARRELDLQRGVGLAHHAAGVELAAILVQGMHGAPIVA